MSAEAPHSQTNTSLFNIDVKRFIRDLIQYWWLFAITVPISLLSVFMVHRYVQPVYSATITLLMEERGDIMPKADIMQGFGLTPGQRSVDNQIAILTSWDIVMQTIDKLDFYVSYFAEGRLKHTEMYGNLTFEVQFDSTHPQLLNTPINIIPIDDKSCKVYIETKQGVSYVYEGNKQGGATGPIHFEKLVRYNEPVITDWASFSIIPKNCNPASETEQYFVFNMPGDLTSDFKSRLRAQLPGESSSIIRVSLTGKNNIKNQVFLNTLAEVFIANNLKQKNLIATNTIDFISQQLLVIADTLQLTGSELSQFRTDNHIQSVSAKAEYLLSGMQELERQLTELKIKRSYYLYLKNYFLEVITDEKVMAPAMYELENSLLKEQIKAIMELNSQRLSIMSTYGEKLNLANKDLENKMNIARKTLLKTINSQLIVFDDTKNRLLLEKEKNEQELYGLPETERRLLGIDRKFQLSNEVYTFLLRKQSEAQIQKASNTPDHQILESARYAGQVSPNKAGNKKKALLLGIIIPLILLALKQLLNNKIIDMDDVERITDLPVIGNIIHSSTNKNNVVHSHPKSIVAEAFRRVRTRIEFLNKGIESPVIGVSSSMPGEGKTFCALNMAAALALSGKKTALLGFDLRKPGLNKIFSNKGKPGISSYLIGKASLDEILMDSGQANLSILPTGDIPPNPSELISSKATGTLIKELKKRFELIIIDTPPMGIVSDPYLLVRHTDTLVFLVRQQHTVKSVLAQTIKNMKDEDIRNVGILLNDIHLKKHRYGYTYNYGYGYGHGYYEE